MTGGEKRQQTEALMIVRYASASSDLTINDINSVKLPLGSYAVQLDEYGTVVPKVLAEYRSAQPEIRDKHGVAPPKRRNRHDKKHEKDPRRERRQSGLRRRKAGRQLRFSQCGGRRRLRRTAVPEPDSGQCRCASFSPLRYGTDRNGCHLRQ